VPLNEAGVSSATVSGGTAEPHMTAMTTDDPLGPSRPRLSPPTFLKASNSPTTRVMAARRKSPKGNSVMVDAYTVDEDGWMKGYVSARE